MAEMGFDTFELRSISTRRAAHLHHRGSVLCLPGCVYELLLLLLLASGRGQKGEEEEEEGGGKEGVARWERRGGGGITQAALYGCG